MRIQSWLLLLGGLLLLLAGPVEASPGTPDGDGGGSRRACGLVDDAQVGAACERQLQLTGEIARDELLLSWQGSRANGFDLFYSSAPYVGYVQIDAARGSSYRELLAHIPMTEINDFYQVREKGMGKVSNRLGVFTFPLAG